MNFGFDEDQEALREAAEKLLAAESPPAFVREALEDPDAWRPLWSTIVDLGWTSLAVPERLGGLGLGVVDLVALAEVTGRWVLPAPWMSAAGLAGPVLAATGAGEGALAGIAEGAVSTLAAEGDVRWDGRTLRGTARRVPDAVRADVLVVLAAGPDGRVVGVVPAHDVRIEPTPAADPNRPLADVHLDVVVPVVAADPEPGLDVARTVLAAELVGVADRILEVTVEHARERVQFDRPIGAFQAVKHRLADLFVAVERARTLTYDAAMVLDDPASSTGRRREVASLAKAAASEAAILAAKSGVQLHGAIAITWEHDLHLFARRARQGASALGDHLFHYRRAAESFLGREG
ncbi:MAG: acyl-CoA dehydrogenase [Acidimicrobiales bacterium]|nr:acyl-CoA dehydrogenase [Acidimicrobiales bacterium]